jgi:hypothetical protein
MTDAEYLARERRRVLRLGLLALALFAAVHVSGLGEGFLYLAPALVLAALLLGGRYPGADLIDRLARRRGPLPQRGAGGRVPLRRRPATAAPCGGLLIALALAGRAPPLRS